MKITQKAARIYGRFSSKPQERGDSRRRQIEGATPVMGTRKTAYYSYRCKNARLNICPQPHKLIGSRLVELAFMDAYFGGSPEKLLASKDKQVSSKIEAIQHRIQQLNKAIENLYDLAEEGDAEAKNRIAQRREEKSKCETELSVLKGSRVELDTIPSLIEEIRQVMNLADIKKAEKLIQEFYPKLETKLGNLEIRRKLSNMLPSMFSKIEFDCVNRTLQAFTKEGKPMSVLDLAGGFEGLREYLKTGRVKIV